MLIYKILLPPEWTEFEARGHFTGSSFDASSGFIHCSSRVQVGATARRVFADEPALVVVALDAGTLGDAVRWELAPDGRHIPACVRPATDGGGCRRLPHPWRRPSGCAPSGPIDAGLSLEGAKRGCLLRPAPSWRQGKRV